MRLKDKEKTAVKMFCLFFVAAYLSVNLFMPYGNHLLFATASSRDGQSHFERFFINSYISKLAVSLRGVQCDAPIRTIPMNIMQSQYFPYENNSILLLIQQYSLAEEVGENKRKKIIFPGSFLKP